MAESRTSREMLDRTVIEVEARINRVGVVESKQNPREIEPEHKSAGRMKARTAWKREPSFSEPERKFLDRQQLPVA